MDIKYGLDWFSSVLSFLPVPTNWPDPMKKMNRDGYPDVTDMATTFNILRANDLIWSFVINNYLMGDKPVAFDLQYWSSDSTRMPAKIHSEYLRAMYLEDRFKESGGMVLGGVAIDLPSVDTSCYFL